MAAYIISYDLIKNKDYKSLINEIKKYSNWAHPTESLWIIISDDSSSVIRDHLKQFMDNDDKLLVIKSSGIGAWTGLQSNVSHWLKNNL
ncbi:hypothetical protein [Buttiauxella brennerae]|uniref:hypothetical protein n=1 Tax=Buttiauxella brennerae TaxID=82988 RepID=UPI0007E2DE01|nr:hypothetical protein [Buttiauxella brennerae]